MALSSRTSSSVPSSPLSEKSGSSRTSAPLLTSHNRRLTQTHSTGHHDDVEPAIPSATIRGWSPSNDDSVPYGWPRLAKVMAERPTLQSFSRFHEANMKNLLYYQVQIAKLERELKEGEWDDLKNTANMEKSEQQACFAEIMVGEPSSQQWKLVLELRKCLHQYSEISPLSPTWSCHNPQELSNQDALTDRALIELSQVSALPEPSTVNVQALFEWLTDTTDGKGNSNVAGCGSKAWGDHCNVPQPPGLPERFRALVRSTFLFWKDQPDRMNCNLVVPCKVEDRDGFTGWVADYWTPFWVALKKHRKGEDDNAANKSDPAEVSIGFYPI